MSEKLNSKIAVIGIDIGKNSFHVVGHVESSTIAPGRRCGRRGRTEFDSGSRAREGACRLRACARAAGIAGDHRKGSYRPSPLGRLR
jgi:hypothetical protein